MSRIVPYALALVFALAACGGGSEPAGPDEPLIEPALEEEPPPPSSATVLAQGFAFNPASVSVTPGTEVRWTNEDSVEHTVTSGTPENPDDAFDLTLSAGGDSGAHVFDDTGMFAYFCKIHPSMRGTVAVEG